MRVRKKRGLSSWSISCTNIPKPLGTKEGNHGKPILYAARLPGLYQGRGLLPDGRCRSLAFSASGCTSPAGTKTPSSSSGEGRPAAWRRSRICSKFICFSPDPCCGCPSGSFSWGWPIRIVNYVRGLDWQLDRVAYQAHPALGIKGAIRSIVHWLVPYYSVGWRAKPLYTFIFFLFHIGLVGVPLFLVGHAVIFKERWGVNWPTMSMGMADILTIAVHGHRGADRHPAPRPARGPDRHDAL